LRRCIAVTPSSEGSGYGRATLCPRSCAHQHVTLDKQELSDDFNSSITRFSVLRTAAYTYQQPANPHPTAGHACPAAEPGRRVDDTLGNPSTMRVYPHRVHR
jgi:hypothetical protein